MGLPTFPPDLAATGRDLTKECSSQVRGPRVQDRRGTYHSGRHTDPLTNRILSLVVALCLSTTVSAFMIPPPIDNAPALEQPRPPVPNWAHDHSLLPPRRRITRRNPQAQTPKNIIYDNSQAQNITIPQPFDGALGTNYTAPGCLPFLQAMVENSTFTDCVPFSLLLQTSSNFFHELRSPSLLSSTLDAGCKADVTRCSKIMSDLNSRVRSTSTCAPELTLRNPIVQQAAAGLAAYDLLQKAACIKSRSKPTSTSPNAPATSSESAASPSAKAPGNATYCFTEAATNRGAPDSFYTYFLPLGLKLPDGAQPACTVCLQDTMALFSGATGQKGAAIADTYNSAVDTINAACGANFVKKGSHNSGAPSRRPEVGWKLWPSIIAMSTLWIVS